MKLLSIAIVLFCIQSIADARPIRIREISMFRSQVVLIVDQNKDDVKVGSRFLAQSASQHKCLLVVTKLKGDAAYTDATRCPGFATLKKGQTVQLSADNEVNEEIREATKSESQITPQPH